MKIVFMMNNYCIYIQIHTAINPPAPLLTCPSGHTELLHTQIGMAAPAIQAEIPPPVRLWPSFAYQLTSHVQRYSGTATPLIDCTETEL